jgi:hypothetical protein
MRIGLKMRNRRQRGYPAALEAAVEPWRTWGDSGRSLEDLGRQGERSEPVGDSEEVACCLGGSGAVFGGFSALMLLHSPF